MLAGHRDRFRVAAVVGGSDARGAGPDRARGSARGFAALADRSGGDALRGALAGTGHQVRGRALPPSSRRWTAPADIVVAAISGTAGLAPTHAALKPGRAVALANKESLVCAGASLHARCARRSGPTILPVDSEHNALHQALGAGPAGGRGLDDADRLRRAVPDLARASGSPRATPAQACAHPTWSMGTKINIDSATLMNKGLELIEAHHLFGLEPTSSTCWSIPNRSSMAWCIGATAR